MKKIFLKFIEIYKKSGKKMEAELFKPLDIKKWLKFGFLSFLNQMPLFLFLFFLNFLIIPSKFLQFNKIFPFLPHIFFIFPFLFFFFLFFFFFFLYISSYSNYFYFELLMGKKDAILSIEKYHKNLSKGYFILSIFFYIILFSSLIVGLFLIFFFKEIFTGFFILIFFIFYTLFFLILNVILKDFYLPLSYYKNSDILENLSHLVKIISLNPFKFFIYVIIKGFLILILYSGVAFMGLMTLGILFIIFIMPILGQTILQPITYFLNIFGLNFFKELSNLEEPLLENA